MTTEQLTIDYKTGEIVTPDDAWNRHRRIVDLRNVAEKTFLTLGEELYYFEKWEQYKDLGFDTFNAYLADTEVDIARSTAFMIKGIFEKYVLKLEVQPVGLIAAGVAKLDILAKHIDESNVEEWVNKASSLSRSDLRQEIRENFLQGPRTKDNPGQVSDFILVGDFNEVGRNIPENSIDIIFTDPPYADVIEYENLAKFGAKVLKPGGLLLAYSGQMHLPEIYSYMGLHLDYLWTCAIRHTGGLQRMFKPNINTGWKPILVYSKPPLEIWWDSFPDITSGGKEKEYHEWQQAEAEAAYFLSALCPKGGLVLDPFCGSGTTLVAAKRLDLKYMGIEIDEDVAVRASKRVG